MKLVSQKKGMILSIFKKLVCKITIPVCREVKQSKDLEYPLERKIIVENKFEIVKHIGNLSDINNGYTKEVALTPPVFLIKMPALGAVRLPARGGEYL